MYRNWRIGVSVPAHNEEAFIVNTLSGIPEYVDRIYVCNDASADGTKAKVEEYMARDSRVVLINHETNTGVGGAIIDCHKAALQDGMELIAVMAGDDQMDPVYLPQLLDPLVEGKADYTKGNRLYEHEALQHMSRWRFTGNKILTILTKFVTGNWNVNDPQNGYTAITAEALRKLPLDGIYKGYLFENDMLVKLNSRYQRIQDVPIPARYGEEVSDIHYYSFITKGLLFMVRAFLWRIREKHIAGKNIPLRTVRVSGTFMMLLGLVATAAIAIEVCQAGSASLAEIALPLVLVAIGAVQFILTNNYLEKHQHVDGE